MTPEQQEIIDKLVTRLHKIQWGYVPEGFRRWYSSQALLIEYLRRVKLCSNQAPQPWSHNLDANIKTEIEQRVEELEIPNWIGGYHKAVIPYIFVWNLFPLSPNQNCLDRYEPILRFYERGAYGFYRETGTIDFFVGKHRFSLRPHQIEKAHPLNDLSGEALDKIDEANN